MSILGNNTWSNRKAIEEALQDGVDLPASSSSVTTYDVTLQPSDILSMAESPIELLPAPGAGKYYDIHKIVLEYNYDSGFSYNMADDAIALRFGNVYYFALIDGLLIQSLADRAAVINSPVSFNTSINFTAVNIVKYVPLNTNFVITTYNETNITDNSQTGTLRVIVDYEIRTLGA